MLQIESAAGESTGLRAYPAFRTLINRFESMMFEQQMRITPRAPAHEVYALTEAMMDALSVDDVLAMLPAL